VENTISGEDGLVRAANIRMSTSRTNCPITKLFPLEVTAEDLHPSKVPLLKRFSNSGTQISSTVEQVEDITKARRPTHQAALRGRQQVQEWAKTLCGPPEDVRN